MGLFGVAKVMRDIVKGGVKSYEADEALDKLLKRAEKEFGDALTPEQRELGERYRDWKRKFKGTEFAWKAADARRDYLKALMENDALPQDFRDELQEAVSSCKKAENLALDTLEEVAAAEAKTPADKEAVHKIMAEQKRK